MPATRIKAVAVPSRIQPRVNGRPVKAGQSFSAAFVVGYFDSIAEMHEVNNRYERHMALSVSPSGWRLEK